MTDDTRYEVCGTSALKPARAPRLDLHEGGRDASPARGQRGLAATLRLSLVAALVAVTVAAAVCAMDEGRAASTRAAFDAAPHEVTYVRAGDCLWSIAERQGGGSVDTAQLVSWIQDANALPGPMVHEGEAIVVPVLGQ